MNFDMFNSQFLSILLGAVVVIPGFVLVIYAISVGLKRAHKMSNRVDQFVDVDVDDYQDINGTGRQIIQREMSGSLLNRTIIRWIKSILKYLGKFTPESMVVDLDHKLKIAGNPGNLNASGFFAIQILLFGSGVFLAILINRDLSNINMNNMMFGMLALVVSLLFPNAWLKKHMRQRQDEIQRGLPDALDMLSVCASAGLGFDQSLQKISSYWDNAFGRELKIVTQEMEMGLSRSDALRNMSNRLDVDDLTRFVAIIIQAETIGMSYADVLHSQALQLRVLRQLRAREIANKLPGKMIMPLALFIFPAMIAVILGPTIPILLNLF